MSHTGAQVAEQTQQAPPQPFDRQRYIELGLVCLLVIAPMFLRGYIGFLLGAPTLPSSVPNLSHLLTLTTEVGALALVAYVLGRTGRTFSSLGLKWRWQDIFPGVLLGAVDRFVYGWAAFYLIFVYHWWTGSYYYRPSTAFLFEGKISVVFIQLACVPFFEEIIVRGYLTTELADMTGSIWIATLLSVMIQASYHLYQGWVATISHVAAFSIYGIYYARTRKLMPCVIAHGFVDFTAFVVFALRNAK